MIALATERQARFSMADRLVPRVYEALMTKQTGKVVFRMHAIERMFQRGISHENVLAALAVSEVVEDYPSDTPYPSALLFGVANGRPLHVVVAHDQDNGLSIIVTVYEPETSKWEVGFRIRKS